MLQRTSVTSMPRLSEAPTRGKYRVPRRLFKRPHLTDDDREAFIEVGLDTLTKIVRDTRLEGGPVSWKLDYAEEGLQIFWGSDIGKSRHTIFMSVTEVPGTLEEAAALHRSDTNEEFVDFNERFHRDLCDCRIIETLAPTTDDHPHNYIGIKWICLETVAFARSRDFVFVECRDDFNVNGVKGFARAMQSVELPNCVPDFRPSMGIVRAKFHASGMVFKEIPSRPGYLQLMQVYNLDLGGKVPTWIQRFSMKRRARSLLRFDTFFRAQRLSALPLLHENDLASLSSRRRCFLCHTKFTAFSTRMNCRVCGEVVCRHCNRQWELTDPLSKHTQLARICVICSNESPATEHLKRETPHMGTRSEPLVRGRDDLRDVRAVSLPFNGPTSPRTAKDTTRKVNGRVVDDDVISIVRTQPDLYLMPDLVDSRTFSYAPPQTPMRAVDDATLTAVSSVSHLELLELFQEMKKLKLEERFGRAAAAS
ncbi:Aste57867_8500 [Aphanomyces stellatus]|uniref:Aste57867_8500 protein n=1 Tax=Aphanomyces stellatus TaxID=120398 RepID=A0A485KKG2_9STRA|nr:hypothetical protein As57867_008468 [Aphanomyces stellatus]VFT85386.1 Aste57867_8500 [Aphanomyces stellatus]